MTRAYTSVVAVKRQTTRSKLAASAYFFLEAKRPGIDLTKALDAAYQIRSYGWNAKLPLCGLTNFRQFLVFDCRKPPKKGESVDAGLVGTYSIQDYEHDWPRIADLFSKDAVIHKSMRLGKSLS